MATPETIAAKSFTAQQVVMQQLRLLATEEDVTYIEDAVLIPFAANDPGFLEAEKWERVGEVLIRVNRRKQDVEATHEAETDIESLEGVDRGLANVLRAEGYYTKTDVADATDEELLAINGIGAHRLAKIREQVGDLNESEAEAEETEEPEEEPEEEEPVDDGEAESETEEESSE